jgi:hypothetical protein
MSNNVNGADITKVFKYVQQVFKDCQQLIYKTDSLMAPDWNVMYGSRITRDVTSSINDPDRWLVEAVFRMYEGEDKSINKGITISFWGNDEVGIEEPIITAGKIVYSDISSRQHWDLWNTWFGWEDDNEDNIYELDGSIVTFKSKECNYISEAKIFSCPLVSISSDTELEEKIVNVLKEL